MFVIKLSTMIIGALLIVLVGEFIRQKYKKKYSLVLQFKSLITDIKHKIQFEKCFLKDIITEKINNNNNDEFNDFLRNYLNNNFSNINFFKNEENKTLDVFFNSLGKNNSEIEVEKIDLILNYLNSMELNYHKILNTNGAMAYKLSICCSLLFLILFA